MKRVLLGLVIGMVVLAFVAISKENKNMLNNIKILNDTLLSYQVKVKGLEEIVTQRDAVILSEKQAKEAGLLEVERLRALNIKSLQTNVQLTSQIHILRDSIKSILPDTVFITTIDSIGNKKEYLQLPFTLLNIREEDLMLRAGMYTNRETWLDLTIPLSGEVTVGRQKKSFLKSDYVGIFSTTNPYIVTNDIQVVMVDSKKWWNNPWLVGGIGMTGGLILGIILQ